YIFPFNEQPAAIRWTIAEWGSRYPLSGKSQKLIREIQYGNKGKRLGSLKEKKGTQVGMGVTAQYEYGKPRVEGTYWPHLLLEQTFLVRLIIRNERFVDSTGSKVVV